jgi:endonuclease YncB( thermonuclease family)
MLFTKQPRRSGRFASRRSMMSKPRRTLALTAAATFAALAAFGADRYLLPRVGLADGPVVAIGAVQRLSASAPASLIGASIALAGAEMAPLDAGVLDHLRARLPATTPARATPHPSPSGADALRVLPPVETPCLEGACAPSPAAVADPEITGSLGAVAEATSVSQSRVFPTINVVDGRSFRSGNTTVRLAGVALPGPRQQCRRLDGVVEPCAERARTRLDLMTRHRPVACDLQPAATDSPALAGACRVGNTDLALWLIREGWATPLSDTPEAAAAVAEARRVKAGVWR